MKEKSPLGKLFDKTTQSPIGVYKLALYVRSNSVNPYAKRCLLVL